MSMRTRIEYAQRVLRGAGYDGRIDGDPGPLSLAAVARVKGAQAAINASWPPARKVIAGAQLILAAEGFGPGPADGFWGPQTDGAFLEWRAAGLGQPFLDRSAEFGTEAELRDIFGPPGGRDCTAGRVRVPWHMVLAWNGRHTVKVIRCHVKIAPAAQRVFDGIADTHGEDELRGLGLHLFGGCFNNRPKRGGTSLSTHAWGVSMDFDPERNRLTWGADRARLGRPDAAPMWAIWEAESFHSLGRVMNYDWMHVQAPRAGR